jgi:hypothetical protein
MSAPSGRHSTAAVGGCADTNFQTTPVKSRSRSDRIARDQPAAGSGAEAGILMRHFERALEVRAGTAALMIRWMPKRSCTGNYVADQRCSAPEKAAPQRSAYFSLPRKDAPGTEVKITGYGGRPLCFMVPSNTLRFRTYAVAEVTQVQPGDCLRFNG